MKRIIQTAVLIVFSMILLIDIFFHNYITREAKV